MDKESALQALKWELEHTKSSTLKDAILALHPELAESEDEKIRKALLRCCDDWEKGQFGCMNASDIPAVRAWLEKKKEQQPVEWSEEDELMRTAVLQSLDTLGNFGTVEMQKDWLKSLRPQSHWKPSEEQIRVFLKATPVNLMPEEFSIYNSFRNDIQKLM